MLTPTRIRQQLAYLQRLTRSLGRDYTIAYLGDDEAAMHSIRAEYRLVCDLMRQLRGELELQREQAAAVLEAERMLGL